MIGFKYFNDFFSKLSDKEKRKVLENIFSVHNILEYYIVVRNSKLFFRIYANGIFYQFVFIFDYSKDGIFFDVKEKNRISCSYIYVLDYLNSSDTSVLYSSFVNILLLTSEDDVEKARSIFL